VDFRPDLLRRLTGNSQLVDFRPDLFLGL
jgi:hypothetical protein